MPDMIQGRVARILNSRELVINRGAEAGVSLGMRFAVLDPAGEDITDPDTGQIIGSLQRPKAQVEIVQVSENISVAKTYRYRMVSTGGTGAGLALSGDIARLFAPHREAKKYETLKASEAGWEPLTEEQSIVKVGDPVIQIDAEDQEQVGGVISDAGAASSTALPSSTPTPPSIEAGAERTSPHEAES
jgi:hypothetical protein